MLKAIEIAKKISKDLESNHLDMLQNANLKHVFAPIFKLNYNIRDCNILVCYIIYAYDNNSNWINLQSDRLDDKKAILKGLGVSEEEQVYSDLVGPMTELTSEVQDAISEYLKTIISWKWRTIITCFDYHADALSTIGKGIKSTDELEKSKINKANGELLKEAIRQRNTGEDLLREIKSEYVKTDRATQQDFGFEITDEQKINHLSWRDWILNKIEAD